MKYIIIYPIITIILVFATPSFASDDIYIDVEPPNFKLIKNQGTIEKLQTRIRSNLNTLYPRGFSWNKKSPGLNFTYSDWLKIPRRTLELPNPQPATHSFTLNIPQQTEPGEYYQMMTYSNIPYTCEESDNPAVLVGTPIDTLVIAGLPTGTIQDKESLHKIHHAQMYLTGFKSYFSLFNQSQNFSFTATNNGNLRAYFSGQIVIKNQTGETVEILKYDQGVNALEPDTSIDISLTFPKSKQLAGSYTAELFLSYKDSLYEYPLTKVDQINFTFVGAYLVLDFAKVYGLSVLIFLIVRQLSTGFFKRRNPAYRFLPYYILIIAVIPAFLYSVYHYSKSDLVQGTVDSGTEAVGISAIVRESTALRVSWIDGKRLVKIVSQNSRKGWELWSFNCNSTRILATDKDFTDDQPKEILVDEKSSRFPLLLLTRFF